MSRYLKVYLIIFTLFCLVFSSIYIRDFRIDASSDTLVAQNDNDFNYFNFYKEIFPSKNTLIVAIESDKEIDKNLLDEIDTISNKLTEIEEIDSVFNINKAPILFLSGSSLIDLSNNNYETINNTQFKIEKVLNEFAGSPIYSNQIINKEKNITSLIIYLNKNEKLEELKKNKQILIEDKLYYLKKSEVDKERKELIDKIRNILKKANKNYTFYLGGIEMISNDVISYVKNDITIFSFVVMLIVLIILFIIFQKIKWVLVIVLSSSFAVYTMIGLVGFFNFEITAISANFISLMFILSISMNIHILNNYLHTDNQLINTFRIMFWPCFYTFLTTVVAFMSLLVADIKPIIDFGLVMIIALVVILITAFTILPLMISFFRKEKIESKINLIFVKKLGIIGYKYKNTILFFNFLFFLISTYGISQLNVENSFIKYFKEDTEIYKGMKLIDRELGGTTPIDVIIKFNEDEVLINKNTTDDLDLETEFDDDIFSDDLFDEDNKIWFTQKKINIIKKIHEYLENKTEIGKVNSIYSLINVANQINKNELSTFELSILYNEIPEQYKINLIYPYLNINENMIKITARVKDSEDIKRSELIKDIREYSNKIIKDDAEIKVNGLLVLYNNMLSSLFSSQIKSLGFVLLAIFIMFLVLFKSIKLSLIGILPNIFASSFILGLIGILKIPLDIMTITIAAISIGIAVDNTIHYLYRYNINKNVTISAQEIINITHLNVGKAVMITSIAISLGFLSLCFSNFVPTVIFGFFTSLAMIFAMIGVLITLPSIFYYLK